MIFIGRFFRFLFSFLIAALVAGLGVATTFGLKWWRELPDYRQLDNLTRSLGAETKVFARDNTPLGSLIPHIGDQAISRTLVNLDEISPFMMAALISNEDRRFFEHYGLDPYGLGRQFQRLARGDNVQGGSTLTNQLVKNTLLLEEYNQARTPDRKVKEWMLSLQVERSFTKEEILQDYLNAIYWGDGGPVELYGIYAASQAYFRTTPKNLTPAQAAYLTVLVPAASRYFDYKSMRPLMKVLFARMVEDRWITQAQADAAWRENLQPRGWKVEYDGKGNVLSAKLFDRTQKELKAVTTNRAPHFMGQVEHELVRRFGRDKVYGSGGLRVYTTLDPKLQNAVETASREARGLPYGATLGATIIDPYTGEVLGMIGQKLVGGAPPADWNNAAQGQRQIGSTIKPLLYTTALSTGLSQDLKLDDKPISFPCPTCRGGLYSPKDFEGAMQNRSMTLREALDRSLNLVTVRLADRIGLQTFFAKLRALGIPPNDGTGLAASLGAVETTPVKMAAAYATFANGGLLRPPRYIARVTTARGEVLYDAANDPLRPTRVWTSQVAFLGLDMIKGVVNDWTEAQGGLSARAKFGEWPVAGKTGTSNGPKDFWFVGTTPVYTGSVWVGKQKGGEMPTYYYSGWVAAPVWRRMMELAHAGLSVRQFSEPPGILYADAPDQQFLKGVKLAYLDPRYRDQASTALEADAPAPVQYAETRYANTYTDPRTVMVDLDQTTNRLATEFTPPQNIIRRRVYIEQLPAYAPDPTPAPLKDETPDPNAVKAATNRGSAPQGVPVTTPATDARP